MIVSDNRVYDDVLLMWKEETETFTLICVLCVLLIGMSYTGSIEISLLMNCHGF